MKKRNSAVELSTCEEVLYRHVLKNGSFCPSWEILSDLKGDEYCLTSKYESANALVRRGYLSIRKAISPDTGRMVNEYYERVEPLPDYQRDDVSFFSQIWKWITRLVG